MGGFGDYSGLYDATDMGMGWNDPNSSIGSVNPNAYDIQLANYGIGVPFNPSNKLYYDNLTGTNVTMDQIRQMAGYENWQPPQNSYSGASDILRSSQGTSGTGAVNANTPLGSYDPNDPNSTGTTNWGQILSNTPGALAALGALGLTGASAAALFGAGNQPGTSTTKSTSTPAALSDPRVQQLLGSTGTGQGAALAGNTGILGAANQAAQNLQGPTGLLQGQISNIPQLNPQIQQAIQGNALGFSQGQVPTLNNPQAQQYFGNMLNSQNAAVDYNTTNSLSNAIDLLRQRGFAGGSEIFREGAPAAAMGPILAAANLAKSQNLGNINSQQLQYATSLPTLGSNLNAAQLANQSVPFNAYTSSLGSQSAIPQNALNSLMNQGNNTNVTQQGASPNLLQTLGQIAPVLGAAGGLATGATANGQNPIAGLYGGISGLFNG